MHPEHLALSRRDKAPPHSGPQGWYLLEITENGSKTTGKGVDMLGWIEISEFAKFFSQKFALHAR